MKRRFIQWLALATLALSASSCGLPDLLGRTVGNTVNKAGAYAGAAMDAAY